jgi:hypothetical protein
MMTTATDSNARVRRLLGTTPSGNGICGTVRAEPDAAPVVVAVDNSRAAAAAAEAAVRVARDLAAPLVFVYVRRGPWAGLGSPTTSVASTPRCAQADVPWTMPSRSPSELACPPLASSWPGIPRTESSSSPACAPRRWSSSGRGAGASAGASRAMSSAARTAPS